MKSVYSLPVASVQDLAEATNDKQVQVPETYIRREPSSDLVDSDSEGEIPVVDFSRLLDPQFTHEESSLLARACEHWGFFQLINHGVETDRIKEIIEQFFKLPLETKNQFKQVSGQLDGYGQLFVISEDQKLDWADVLYLNTLPVDSRNMKFWPSTPPTFRDTLDNYSSEVNQISNSLLAIITRNLGLKPDTITNKCKDGVQSVRINYYPKCPQADKVMGFSPHSDADLLTLVLQVNDVQGLQIRKNRNWVPVKPLKDAFVVNLGDQFQIFTNGKYKSIEHRAVVNSEKERVSIAAFHSPNLDAMIGPLTEFLRKGDEIYKTLDHQNFMKLFFSSKLEGKSFLDLMTL